MEITHIIFDWGDTLMRDLPGFEGPMAGWPRVELVDGVVQALKKLDPRISCWVASNARESDAALLMMALERAGIASFFRFAFTEKELGFAKPDPEFFREILRRLGATAEATVSVGNSLANDIAPAKAVGLATVLLGKPPAPQADVIIAGMSDLPAALDRLRRSSQD